MYQQLQSMLEQKFQQALEISPQKHILTSSNQEEELISVNPQSNTKHHIDREQKQLNLSEEVVQISVEKSDEDNQNVGSRKGEHDEEQARVNAKQEQMKENSQDEIDNQIEGEQELHELTHLQECQNQSQCSIDEVHQEDDVNQYKSLSEKLQKALNKISTEKQLSTVSHSKNEFFDRIERFQKKKIIEIEQMKKEKQKKESLSFKKKPMINSVSAKMISNYEPIYSRYEKVLENKKRKIQQQKHLKEKKQEEEFEVYQKELEQHMHKITKKIGNMRSNEQFAEEMKVWSEKKEKNIAAKKEAKLEEQNKSLSFKPEINAKSLNLMKKNGVRIPIYEREIQAKKNITDSECTFAPNTHKLRK